ncbi:hypothetical protein ACLB2K_041465 [Fragaria x ananassa]
MAAPPQPILIFFLITVSAFHLTLSKPNGFTLKLIPRDSPESPIYPGNLTTLERIERLIEFSQARARYIELTSSPNATTLYPENIRLTLLRDNFFYMVQVGVGTPATGVFLLLDTGWSNLDAVPTFLKLLLPKNSHVRLDNECVYNINYGGGASTAGIASIETFTFPVDTATTVRLGPVVFGCSKYTKNVQFANGGAISGILALSLSPDSLASQLGAVTQKRFSYCLVPFTQAQQAPSLVRFGDDIPHPSSNIQITPFVPTTGSHYFQLNLLDISVGFNKLGLPPGTFAMAPDGSGGCIIDSGALIPQINQNVVGGINSYRKGGYFCVALMPGNGKSILGAWHQQNMRVTYNGNTNSLEFLVETRSNDVEEFGTKFCFMIL